MFNIAFSHAQKVNAQIDSLKSRVTILENQVYSLNSQISNILNILKEMSKYFSNGDNSNRQGQRLFDTPGQKIEAKTLKVIQVIGDGALAIINDLNYNDLSTATFGTVLYLKNKAGESYYDDQIIKIPSRKVLRQIGTFTYITQKEEQKTVPIVEIFDK